jgi:hypothetical protein
VRADDFQCFESSFLLKMTFFETFLIYISTDQRAHVDCNTSERIYLQSPLLSGPLLCHRSIFSSVYLYLDLRKIRQLVIGGFLKEFTYSRGKYL